MKHKILIWIIAGGAGFLGGTIYGIFLIRSPELKYVKVHFGDTRKAVHLQFGDPDVVFTSYQDKSQVVEMYSTFLNKFVFIYSKDNKRLVKKWREY